MAADPGLIDWVAEAMYDDADDLRHWGLLALEAGRRAPPGAARKRKKG